MTDTVEYAVAQWDSLGDGYWLNRPHRQKWLHYYVLYPEIIRLINLVPHDRILDFGCGDGALSALLSQRFRQCSVTAFDSSEKMLDNARQMFGQGSVVDDLDGMRFDVICANMVFQDVFNPVTLLQELKQYLRKNGRIIISIPHPVFSLKEADHLTTRRLVIESSGASGYDRYPFEETEKVIWDNVNEDNWTYLFNRKISTYASYFYRAGLVIEQIGEPLPVKEGRCEEDLYLLNSTTPRSLIFCLVVQD